MCNGFFVPITLSLIFVLGIPNLEAQKGPVQVGLLLPVTGVQAGNGKDMVNGFQRFLDEARWEAGSPRRKSHYRGR